MHRFICVYRSPGNDTNQNCNLVFLCLVSFIVSVGGDFNLRNIHQTSDSDVYNKLLHAIDSAHFIIYNGLSQLV